MKARNPVVLLANLLKCRTIVGIFLASGMVAPIAAQQAPVQPGAIRNLLDQASQAKGASQASTGAAKPVVSQPQPPALTPVANPIPAPPASPKAAPKAKPAIKTPAPAAKPAAISVPLVRRDPFAPLVTNGKGDLIPANLPPGKAGLLISTLHIDGIVRGPNGMIAIVSNPQQRVYFLRDGDHLYDGQVQHISMEGVAFHQAGRDPFGNPVEHEISKLLSVTPGEQR